MNNVMFVKTPSFIVNANGRLSESLRADENKGQRKLAVEKRNFESLKAALAWINKEGQKKSTILYLYEIRPAAHGTYAIGNVKQPAKKVAPKATNTNRTAKTVANTANNNSNNTSNNANTPRRTAVKK